jgi:hypothetical protein
MAYPDGKIGGTRAKLAVARARGGEERAAHAREVGNEPGPQPECFHRLMDAHSAAVEHDRSLGARRLQELAFERRIDQVHDPMPRRDRVHRHRVAGKAKHADRRRIHHARRLLERGARIGCNAGARPFELRRYARHEAGRAGAVVVVHEQAFGAEIEERESQCSSRAAGPDQQGHPAFHRGAAKRFLKTAAKADPVGVVTSCPAVGIERDGVDRADLTRFRRDLVEEPDHRFLARIGDVEPGESGRARGRHEIGESPARQAVEIHQVVVTDDARRHAGVLVQRG